MSMKETFIRIGLYGLAGLVALTQDSNPPFWLGWFALGAATEAGLQALLKAAERRS